MTEKVELSVPYQVSALERASDMLAGMARDLQGGTAPTTRVAEKVDPPEADYPDTPESEGGAAPGPDLSVTDPAPEKPAADVEVDEDGLPWNAEIHSRNKSKDKNGRWKKRRIPKDMTDEQWSAKIAEVEQQLRDLMAVGTEGKETSPEDAFPAPAPQSGPEPAPNPEEAFPNPQASGQEAPAPEPVTEEPAPTPPPTADDTPDGFQALMQRVTSAVREGRTTTAEINEIVKSHGIASMPMLGANPKAIAVVWPEIKAAIEKE